MSDPYMEENRYDPKKHKDAKIEKVYRYCDEKGVLLYEKVRFKNSTGHKLFKYRRPDPDDPGGKPLENLNGVKRVPYLLEKWFKESGKIIIAEGEKDTDAIDALGFLATCAPFGAGSWPEEITKYFKGRIVYIVYDVDDKGKSGTMKVADALFETAAEIFMINLPSEKDGYDISDYLEENKDEEDAAIQRLFTSAEQYTTDYEHKKSISLTMSPEILNSNTDNIEEIPAEDNEIKIKNSFLCEYVESISRITDAPQCFILFSGLALLSAILNHFSFYWAMPTHLNLYILLLAQSTSERKSTVIDIVYDYLTEVKKIAPEPVNLIFPSEFSLEAFFDELMEHNHGIILWRELNVVKSLFDKAYGKGLSAKFTNIWDGRPISQHFKNAGYHRIDNPIVSILCGGIGEWLVEGLKKLDFQGGLWTRFLFVPVSARKKKYQAPGNFILDNKILFQLRKLSSLSSKGVMLNIETVSEIHRNWMISLTEEKQKLGNAIIETFYNKLEINALKIAGLLQLTTMDHSTTVGVTAMEDAIVICEWIKRRLPSLLHRLLSSEWDRDRERILNVLDRRGESPTKKIYQYANIDSEHGLRHLDNLIKEGIVGLRDTKPGTRGRPGKIFFLIRGAE